MSKTTKGATATANVEEIHISPPNIKSGSIWIYGTAPLVVHKFSHKAKMQIKAKQEAGSTATKNRKKEAMMTNDALRKCS